MEKITRKRKCVHMTNHPGTRENMIQVCRHLSFSLENIPCLFPLYISKEHADELWEEFGKDIVEDYDTLIFTDTCMYARPFLQHIDDHSCDIVIYVTNRFDWGIWGNRDESFYQLYREMSLHPRVRFTADNRYDYFYAQYKSQIFFLQKDIIRLTPLLDSSPRDDGMATLTTTTPPTPPTTTPTTTTDHSHKLFFYNRGNKIDKYKNELDKYGVAYDVFGEGFGRYRDTNHILEYTGFLHLPYQTNIQSLWENLGAGIVYFIPSLRFFRELIQTQDSYYWEEKNREPELREKNIELTEWYIIFKHANT
jgi:hypothetical protein